jgi:two-component system invasion response regulator UvrY
MNLEIEERICVLGVDDQAIFLDVAREVVAATPGFQWVGGAASGEEALAAVADLAPDLVLLDVRMPGMDGIEAAQRITRDHPDVVVVLISIEEAGAIGPAVEGSGASALVRKQEFGPKMLRRLWQRHRKRVA